MSKGGHDRAETIKAFGEAVNMAPAALPIGLQALRTRDLSDVTQLAAC